MSKMFFIVFVSIIVTSCNSFKKDVVDNKIALRTDTINTIKITDTLVIYASTCRGCEFEKSTNFAISDSFNMIKLVNVITTDNSPAGMDGGSINKDLILVPVKTGTTNMKVFKFWKLEKTAADSTRFTSYEIEVKQ